MLKVYRLHYAKPIISTGLVRALVTNDQNTDTIHNKKIIVQRRQENVCIVHQIRQQTKEVDQLIIYITLE